MVVGSADRLPHQDGRERRVITPAEVRDRVVRPGGGIVGQVDIHVSKVVPCAVENVIRLNRHRVAELSLHTDRRLVAVGDFGVRARHRRVDRLPEAPRHFRRAAGARKVLLQRRNGAVERVRHEVGPAVVLHLNGHLLVRSAGEQVRLVGDLREVLAISAADDGAVVDAEREAEPGRVVVRVLASARLQPGLHGDVLRIDVAAEVIPQSEVQRQAAHLPVVLRPAGIHMPRECASCRRQRQSESSS